MKFAREYRVLLQQNGFPEDWVSSAISYGKLKKCIKQVQRELASLGLDVDTLHRLLQHVEASRAQAAGDISTSENPVAKEGLEALSLEPEHEKPFHYLFSGTQVDVGPVRPKLLFVVDAETGEPMDASLTAETRNYLHQLAISEHLTRVRITDDEDDVASLERSSSVGSEDSDGSTECLASPDTVAEGRDSKRASQIRERRYVEVPLTSDSEFFKVLEKELSGLVEMQEREKAKLSTDIQNVARVLGTATCPDSAKRRADLDKWRQLFELYLESNIFFATQEQDHGVHDGAKAQQQYDLFLSRAKQAGLLGKFKKPESAVALQNFLTINNELLQCLKFQEINQIAMTKILKKFDKRTALGAKATFREHLPSTLNSQDFSKALAAQVSNQIISVVPQLEDYLCPICFQLAYRPIRLRCQHVFCIRCLIVMQRAGKDNCALCREPTVMEADGQNLDQALQNFLKRYFEKEAKQKQKLNERLIMEEHAAMGGDITLNQGYNCAVM